MVSCKPDADVQKWFNSGNLLELDFEFCEVVNPEAFDQPIQTSLSSYLFKYDKLTRTALLQAGSLSYRANNVAYNKFRSDETQITLQNNTDDYPSVRFVIFPAGKKYIMSMYTARYRKSYLGTRDVFDSWVPTAYFTQDKGDISSIKENFITE